MVPEKQTRELSPSLLLLKLLRTPIAERLMQALPVIEPVNIVGNWGWY